MRNRRKLNNFYWFFVKIAPVLFMLALHFVDFSAFTDVIGTGVGFGVFGQFIIDLLEFFGVTLGLYQYCLVSIVDWSITVSICRIVYDLLYFFTGWLCEVFEGGKHD